MRRVIDTQRPVDLRLTLAPLARWPCAAWSPSGMWRATRMPSGPVTMHVSTLGARRVAVRAWGAGAEEALEEAPELVGAADGDGGLASSADPTVRLLAHRTAGLRIGRSGNLLEALVPTVLEQKVQGHRARASFRAMVRAAGALAPATGEPGAPRLLLLPTATWLLEQPVWRWHRWGVEQKRAATVRAVASCAHRLTPEVSPAALRSIPGIGAWSAAEVALVALGDADAVSVGDFWLKHWVCHTLAGEARGTDARMLELLAPWRGQRGRLCRAIMVAGCRPPRYGPRLPLVDIAGW